jgi:peptidoglycan/LPS O-acetylase OafA/YrhL
MVLVWHFVGAMIDPQLGSWTKIVYHLTILGRTGVDLFFVLSGFLITGIILDRKKSARPFLVSFYARRLLRIAPSYLLLVLVFWSVVSQGVRNDAFNADTPLWHHLTFTQNWWMAAQDKWGPGAISVTWSVAIEEQFYIAFPVLVILTPHKRLPLLLTLIAGFSIASRAFAYFYTSILAAHLRCMCTRSADLMDWQQAHWSHGFGDIRSSTRGPNTMLPEFVSG